LYHLASSPRTSSSLFKQFLNDQKGEVSQELKLAAEQAALAIAQFEHANALSAVKAIRTKVAIDSRPTAYYKAQGHLFDSRAFNQLLDAIVDSPCQFEIIDLQIPHDNSMESTAYIKIWSDNLDPHEMATLARQIQSIAGKHAGVVVAEVDRDVVPKTGKKN